MSRGVFALVALGFALAPARAADPKPVWEIDTLPVGKEFTFVQWVGFTHDGKTLAAQIEKPTGETTTSQLLAWEIATRKETLNHKLGHGFVGSGVMRAYAITKADTVLIGEGGPGQVRLSDGKTIDPGFSSPRSSLGVWVHASGSNGLWLVEIIEGRYQLVHANLSSPAADPKKPASRDEPLKAKLPGDWPADRPDRPAVTADSNLARLAVSSREHLTLYTVSADKELKLTEIATVKSTHRGRIISMRFSPDGKTLATADGSASVFLWDVEKAGKDWKPRATIPAGTLTVSALAFSPDGRTLAAGTFDRKVANLYVIDAAGGKLLGSYKLPGQLCSVAYSPDSKTLITGNHLGLIQAWDAEKLRNP